jgi:hypothetical protein
VRNELMYKAVMVPTGLEVKNVLAMASSRLLICCA